MERPGSESSWTRQPLEAVITPTSVSTRCPTKGAGATLKDLVADLVANHALTFSWSCGEGPESVGTYSQRSKGGPPPAEGNQVRLDLIP